MADTVRGSCLIICEMRERERDASPCSMASSRAARDGSQKKEARSLLKILVQSETRMSLTVNLSDAMLPRLIGSQEFS